MSTFGVQAFSNGPGGETYKSLFVIYRCDICGQLFDNDFADSHAGVHELRNALRETSDESNGIVTLPSKAFDQIQEALEDDEQQKEEFSTQQDEGEDG